MVQLAWDRTAEELVQLARDLERCRRACWAGLDTSEYSNNIDIETSKPRTSDEEPGIKQKRKIEKR